MTDDPSIREQSYAYFLQEAPQLLQILEQELLSLRENWSINKVHALMRATHTLKGAAASVGLESIKWVAHSLEDIFKALCQPDITIDRETEALLFEAYECLRVPLTAQLSGSQSENSEIFDRAAAIFSQLQEKLGDCFDGQGYIPTSTELGFDMTQSIFEVGVTQRLETIARVLASGDGAIASTLQTQAEVFLGLAESLNLPGFGAIAAAALAALDRHPEQAATIAEAALADFQQGQADILAGDRTSGGQLSPFLQQLAGEAQETEGSEEVEEEKGDINSLLATLWTISESPEEVSSDAQWEQLATPSSDDFGDRQQTAPNTIANKDTVSVSHTVRVNVEHLERLNYVMGELLTNQNRQSLQDETLQGEIQTLHSLLQQHQHMLAQLQDWFDPLENCPPELNALLQSLLSNTLQLETTTNAIDLSSQQSGQLREKQSRLLTSAHDDFLAMRMVPLGEVFNRLPRVLQQLETLHGKSADLKLSGTEVQVDKAVAEKLYEPLLHLVRNAFDHGIEPTQVRQQRGKFPTGEIQIRAFHQGSHLTIEVQDDGQGINFERIRQKAIEFDLVAPEQAHHLNEAQLMDLLFEPGFSTAEQVNNISGRGIGLDAVRAQLQALQGAVTVYSQPHRGTTFLMQIPFSMTMAQLCLCQAGSSIYALLTNAIEQIIAPGAHQIQFWEGKKVLRWSKDGDEQLIGVRRLAEILPYFSSIAALVAPKKQSSPTCDPLLPTILLRYQEQLLAVEVDQILGEQELVVRPLDPMIVPPRYVYGGSILADGRLALAIDSTVLAKYLFDQYSSEILWIQAQGDRANNSLVSATPSILSSPPIPQIETTPAAILLVEDSLTQRQTLALTLQKSGYQVLQASDGREAIEKLQLQPDIDLVICDLEMPRINGFEFLNYRQQDPGLAQVPVIVLTSSTQEQHRLVAIELGATAFMSKPYLEQELLATVANLLENASNFRF